MPLKLAIAFSLARLALGQTAIVHLTPPVVRQGRPLQVLWIELPKGSALPLAISFRVPGTRLALLPAAGVSFSAVRQNDLPEQWVLRSDAGLEASAALLAGNAEPLHGASVEIETANGARTTMIMIDTIADEARIDRFLLNLLKLPRAVHEPYWAPLCAEKESSGCALRVFFPTHGEKEVGRITLIPPMRREGAELSTFLATGPFNKPIVRARVEVSPLGVVELAPAPGTRLRLSGEVSASVVSLEIGRPSTAPFGGLVRKRLMGTPVEIGGVSCEAASGAVPCKAGTWQTLLSTEAEAVYLVEILDTLLAEARDGGYKLPSIHPPSVRGVTTAKRYGEESLAAPMIEPAPVPEAKYSLWTSALVRTDADAGLIAVYTDATEVTGFEFTVQLPEGIELVDAFPPQRGIGKFIDVIRETGGRATIRVFGFDKQLIAPGEVLVLKLRRIAEVWPEEPAAILSALGVSEDGAEIPFKIGPSQIMTVSGAGDKTEFNIDPSTSATKAKGLRALAAGIYSRCDINEDGVTTVFDVQRIVNMSRGVEPCTARVAGPQVCNVVAIQRVVNAALGQTCRVTFFTTVTWVDSDSPGVNGYEMFRNSACAEPYSQVNQTLITAKPWYDMGVSVGQSICYVMKAVNTAENLKSSYSAPSNDGVPLVIPVIQ